LSRRLLPSAFSRGVSKVHALFDRLLRKLPENVLPPLFVIMLITPPLNRPYSAEMPDVSTLVCSTASSMKTGCALPNKLSFTSTPLIMKTLSREATGDGD
jgi:hypothetical protein